MSVPDLDVSKALSGLKDFQRRTVDYVFRRMYEDTPPAARFLVADEVGLGKTLVARGIIAKAVEHLHRAGSRQINVLYICSNASIAQQNLRKLNATEQDTSEFATRLTLLPVQLRTFEANGVNFISFTPDIAFKLKRGGWIKERALIYQMLESRLDLKPRLLSQVLQGGAGLRSWNAWSKGWESRYDVGLADRFTKGLAADGAFMARIKALCDQFYRIRKPGPELKRNSDVMVGELRRRLADVCVDALKPDLVVLDEFQRFKDLLHGQDDAADLAQRLFTHPEVRILLLSATPYRMLSMDAESQDDHYADFVETLRFLFSGDDLQVQGVKEEFRQFRQALYGLEPDATGHATAARDRLEGLLRPVIARTERIDVTAGGNAMVVERHPAATLTRSDLLATRFVDKVARCVESGDTIEYWKSSPYLVNFMGEYELKRKLLERCNKTNRAGDELYQAFASTDGELLRNAGIQKYREVDPANPRLRALMAETVDAGQWRWLWLPPSLPYLAPRGAYAGAAPGTKSLVFSNWQVVPKAIAALCSFEAERRMLTSAAPAGGAAPQLPKYRLLHKERRPLLRFSVDKTERRPTGMPTLALLYPCATLAAVVDPMRLAVALGGGSPADADRVKAVARERLAARLAALPAGTADEGGRVDERWYWAAPALLDRQFAEDVLPWLDEDDPEQEGFLGALADEEGRVGGAVRRHLSLFRDAAGGRLSLGRRPDDLADVMVELALGGPGVCAVRAMQRVASDLPETSPSMLSSAVRIATGMRSLFNQPEAAAMLADPTEAVPYWRNVLHYCIEGNLQAVLDEYAHILRDAEGLGQRCGNETAKGLAEAMAEALSLRTSTLDVDGLKATPGGQVRHRRFRMRCQFALRFGDVRDDGGKTLVRSGSVRQAFNSPFRPFVLASTSVGQEGLDFHPYCHVVYHWNLPANPVDLEQREGRVHRYKGHAVRRNIARTYGLAALAGMRKRGHYDPWEVLFQRAAADRPAGASELVPYWLFEAGPGGYAVERRVPMLPLSREVGQLQRLKRMLAVYRLAFGQPRQEDLLCYLTERGGASAAGAAGDLRLRLSPSFAFSAS